MTLLQAISRARDPEQRAIGRWDAPWDVTTGEVAGVTVSRETALGVAAVWACVSLISDTIATLPLAVYDSEDAPQKLPKQPGWLDAPNPEQTLVDFKFGTVASLLLDGNAPVYTVRDRKQDVVEAWVLDPRWVQIRREPDANGQLRVFYYVMVGEGQQSPVGPFRVPAGPEMFHIMAFQPNSSLPFGIGPLDVARMMFGSGIAGQEMGGRWFGTGFNSSGVIEVDDDLQPEQAKQLKTDFKNLNAGLRKMHLPPVLTGGAKFKQIQISPEQAQFIEQRKFSVDEVARFFRVPPHMIGNLEKTTSWGAGIEEQSIGFIRYTLRPWLERIEEAWTRHMLTFQPGAKFRFDLRALERGNLKDQAEFFSKIFLTGAMSPNQIAAALGEPAYEGGDDHYYAVNAAPVGTEPIRVQKIPVDLGPVKGDVQPAQPNLDESAQPARSSVNIPEIRVEPHVEVHVPPAEPSIYLGLSEAYVDLPQETRDQMVQQLRQQWGGEIAQGLAAERAETRLQLQQARDQAADALAKAQRRLASQNGHTGEQLAALEQRLASTQQALDEHRTATPPPKVMEVQLPSGRKALMLIDGDERIMRFDDGREVKLTNLG